MLAGQAPVVRVVAHGLVDLRGDDHILAWDAGFLEQLACDPFAFAQGIDIGRIEEVDAGLQGTLDEGPRLLLLEHPLTPFFRPVTHHAQAQTRDLQTRLTEIYILHKYPLEQGPQTTNH